MLGPTGFIRSTSSATYLTGPTGTRRQIIDYNTVRTKLNEGKELAPDERKFVVYNEARFAEDIDCNSSCKDAVAVIHKGSGRTRHARRRKTRRSTRRGARASRKRPTR